jgi:exonuclease VII large subunit
MGLSGTLTNPFSVEDAIAYCQTLSGESANDFFIKGKISRIANNGTFGSYGNATFFISDDGTFLGEDDKNPDKAHDFEAYRVLWLNNQKWTEGNAQISVGDEVIICGKLTLYNGIAETSGNKAYIYSINGVTTDANGIGSLEAPFNIAGAMSCIDNGWTGDVFVQGIVSKFANNGEFGAKYGNGTFWISDDGTFYDDLTKDFEAYRVLWLGNKKWEEGDEQLQVGDHVVLHGQLTKYGSTYETNQNKAYVYQWLRLIW